jgi:predicted metal-dependent HD superfamily phosphohydrolase
MGTPLDQVRWTGLWSRLGAAEGLPVFEQLTRAYSDPARFYHTPEHIRDCLAQLDRARDLAVRPDEVEAALWFHDAVYRPGAADNEEHSAELARTALIAGSAERVIAERVAVLVLATRHSDVARSADEALVSDIDLSILGREPDIFEKYERQIRREYGFVPESLYRAGRSTLMAEFLRRRSIYRTDAFRRAYEAQARINLERLLWRLGQQA